MRMGELPQGLKPNSPLWALDVRAKARTLQAKARTLQAKARTLQAKARILQAKARTLQTTHLQTNCRQEENDEPQPQEREEFGLMKLNPCRINVSS